MKINLQLPQKIENKLQHYSPFEQKVWRVCAQIPKGQTRTYAWIAKEIGRPGASRAVGTALGKNPFAPLIPCHRVIRSDGKIGNYSGPGGRATKIKLLRSEGALKKEDSILKK